MKLKYLFESRYMKCCRHDMHIASSILHFEVMTSHHIIQYCQKLLIECPRRFMYVFTTCRQALENASLHTEREIGLTFSIINFGG
jgi:hypothetical protein